MMEWVRRWQVTDVKRGQYSPIRFHSGATTKQTLHHPLLALLLSVLRYVHLPNLGPALQWAVNKPLHTLISLVCRLVFCANEAVALIAAWDRTMVTLCAFVCQ